MVSQWNSSGIFFQDMETPARSGSVLLALSPSLSLLLLHTPQVCSSDEKEFVDWAQVFAVVWLVVWTTVECGGRRGGRREREERKRCLETCGSVERSSL